jgi:hypothetical protein
MKTVVGGLVLVSFVLGFSSCQKEIDWGLNIPTQNDSSYLDKVIFIDTTLPSGTGTIGKHVFIYDNMKRLTNITLSYGTGFSDSAIQDLFYTGNETLPFKHVYRDVYSGLNIVDTIYYYYSGSVVARDSVNRWNLGSGANLGAKVFEFTINGPTVNIRDKDYNFVSGNYVLASDNLSVVNISGSGGNFISQSIVSGSSAYESVQASYDNKFNPLSKVFKVKYPIFESRSNESWLIQKNNALQIQFMEPFSTQETDVYTYVYRTDNYPVSATFSSTRGGNYNKLLYFYKTL